MELQWDPSAIAHMWERHRVTAEQAEEALADPYAVVKSPDPASRSGRSDRYIGLSAELGVVVVILVRHEGALYGANAWPANEVDRKLYWERRIR